MPSMQPSPEESAGACRLGIVASVLTMIGIVLSGPAAVAIVEATHPQPPWDGPVLFARSFHPVQTLPYPGGILLIGGVVALIVSLHALAPARARVTTTLGVVCAGVFATLIALNYIVQTSYVPVLARDPTGAQEALLSALSMANPTSLAWALEMWGWGIAGLGTALVARALGADRVERATASLCLLNGAMSVAGAIATAVWPGWVLRPVGLGAFGAWNVLLFVLAGLSIAVFRRRLRSP